MKKRRRKSDSLFGNARVDRRAFSVVSSFDEADQADRADWASLSLDDRLKTMEMLRRIYYGKAATRRLQRVLEVVQSEAR
jgi:hypothetical protein